MDKSVGQRPLVSVVTGTYNRPSLLRRCIEQVRAQTYRPLEHVIVHDGPTDGWFYDLILDMTYDATNLPEEQVVGIRPLELGFQTSQFLAFSHAACPFMVAQLMARGELQLWMSDDEEMDVDHIEQLVELLEAGNHDFVYSQCWMYFRDKPEQKWVTGKIPQDFSNCTGILYRRELLDYKTFIPHVGSGHDWQSVSEWIEAGASYGLLDKPTFTHRVDVLPGENPNQNLYRQPLRGNKGHRPYLGPRWNGWEVDHKGNIQKGRPRVTNAP